VVGVDGVDGVVLPTEAEVALDRKRVSYQITRKINQD